MTKGDKGKISEGLELTILKNRVVSLEMELKQFKIKHGNVSAMTPLPSLVENLKCSLVALKKRISLGHRQPDDNYRLLALENEIGRVLLMMDGIL